MYERSMTFISLAKAVRSTIRAWPSQAHTRIPQVFVHPVSCHCLSLGSEKRIVMD